MIMRISKDENVEMHRILFEDWVTYDKWAPNFYQEFVKKNSVSILAGVMGPGFVTINDSLDNEFFSWLKEKGIDI